MGIYTHLYGDIVVFFDPWIEILGISWELMA